MSTLWESHHGGKTNRMKWSDRAGGAEVAKGMELRAHLCSYIDELSRALVDLPLSEVESAVELILAAQGRGSAVYVFGNGGSAATASHIACDLLKTAIVDGVPRLRVTALADNVAVFSAWANDVSYDRVFAEQLLNFGRHGDIALAISASGNSPNVLAAVDEATALGMYTVGLSGFGGGMLADTVDLPIVVGSNDYGRVEDVHLAVGHAITSTLRAVLAGRPDSRSRVTAYRRVKPGRSGGTTLRGLQG